MKKDFTLLTIIAFILLFFGSKADASIKSSLQAKTVPFGGRVISTSIPTVTCEVGPGGRAPVVLSSNLAGLGSAGLSTANGQQKALQKVNNIGVGIYKAIPIYTKGGRIVNHVSTTTRPSVGDWILGNQSLIPNLTACQTTAFGAPIPFPVVESSQYQVSN